MAPANVQERLRGEAAVTQFRTDVPSWGYRILRTSEGQARE